LVARGDVVWLDLEQEGRRPVLVLTATKRFHGFATSSSR
jgi:mRNA-degrading endonuclease toxin of MazEF toxin-antitoxin module